MQRTSNICMIIRYLLLNRFRINNLFSVIIIIRVNFNILISESGGCESFIRADIVFLSVYNPLIPDTIGSSADMSIIIVIVMVLSHPKKNGPKNGVHVQMLHERLALVHLGKGLSKLVIELNGASRSSFL